MSMISPVQSHYDEGSPFKGLGQFILKVWCSR